MLTLKWSKINNTTDGAIDIKKIGDSLKVQEEHIRKKISKGLMEKLAIEVEKKLNLAKNFKFLGINDPNDKLYGTGKIFSNEIFNNINDRKTDFRNFRPTHSFILWRNLDNTKKRCDVN